MIPLAGVAFLSVGRHPLAGLALGFAAVAGAFTVNMLIKPLDAVLTEFTNDAIHLVDPNESIGLTANLWFSIASVVVSDGLDRVHHRANDRAAAGQVRAGEREAASTGREQAALSAEESRGLKYALSRAGGGAGRLWSA